MVALGWRGDPARRTTLRAASAALLVQSAALAVGLHLLVPRAGPALLDPARAATGAAARVAETLAVLGLALLVVLAVLVAGRVAVTVQASAAEVTRWVRARGLSAWQGLAAAAVEAAGLLLPALLLPGTALLVLSARSPDEPTSERVLLLWVLVQLLTVCALLVPAGAAAAAALPRLAREEAPRPVGRVLRDALVVVLAAAALVQLAVVGPGRWSTGLVAAGGCLLVLAAALLLGRLLPRPAGATLLVLATATVVLLLTAQASLQVAAADARGLEVGAAVAVTTARPPAPGDVARGSAALAADGVASVAVLEAEGSVGGEGARLLALDAAQAADVLRWRPDLAPAGGAAAALDALVVARPAVPTLPVPEGTRGFTVQVRSDRSAAVPVDAVLEVAVDVVVVHADGSGAVVDAGQVGPAGGTATGRPLAQPLPAGTEVVGADVTVHAAPGAEGTLDVGLATLTAVTDDGPVALDLTGAAWEVWASRSTEAQRPGGSPLLPAEAVPGTTGPGVRAPLTLETRTDRLGPGPAPTGEVPALVAGLPAGGVVELQGAGPLTRLAPVATADRLPRAGGRGAVVDLRTLTLARLGAGSAPPLPRSWLLGPGAQERAVEVLAAAGVQQPDDLVVTGSPQRADRAGAWAAVGPGIAVVLVLALVGVAVDRTGGPGRSAARTLAVAVVAGPLVGLAVAALLLPALLAPVLDGAPAALVLPLPPPLPAPGGVLPAVLG